MSCGTGRLAVGHLCPSPIGDLDPVDDRGRARVKMPHWPYCSERALLYVPFRDDLCEVLGGALLSGLTG